VEPPPRIVTETEFVKPPRPSVPKPDELNLRDFEFIIVTPENVEEVFANMRGDKALFALTSKGYENIALNLSDIRAFIQQQNVIIATYEKVWE
jgi:hypothetical protein